MPESKKGKEIKQPENLIIILSNLKVPEILINNYFKYKWLQKK